MRPHSSYRLAFYATALVACRGDHARERVDLAAENAAYAAELDVCLQQARAHTKTLAEYEDCAAHVDREHGIVTAKVRDAGADR